jgi:hypothetical protein
MTALRLGVTGVASLIGAGTMNQDPNAKTPGQKGCAQGQKAGQTLPVAPPVAMITASRCVFALSR